MGGSVSREELLRALDGRGAFEEPHGSDDVSARLASLAVLAAGAAHDMLGPLTYVLSNLEYLDAQLSAHESDLPPGRARELRQCLGEAALGARQVREIVRDLPCGSRGATPESHVDLRRLLLSCVKVARTEIEHRARVITEFDAIPPILGNESRLSRLFLNLLINAAQAVAGDAEKEHFIRIVTRTDPSRRVVIEITDSGPGIPEAHLSRVFEPFFTTKPAHQGTGLGLAICHRLAGELGGTIEVESSAGSGATFRVTLPGAGSDRPTHRAPRDDERFAPSLPPVRQLPLRQLG